MPVHLLRAALASLTALSFTAAAVAQPLFIDTVPVGNPNNAADPSDGDVVASGIQNFGAVGYEYRIGKYEVTNSQYVAFLNAVAAADPYGLYNPLMESSIDGVAFEGGITRSGSSGSYTYAAKPGYENKPVVYVSYWDAARFANWLGTGTTEGRTAPAAPLLPGAAYDLGFVANPALAAGNRLGGATIFLPSENEWYKAAFHQPSDAGGDTDNYWRYATGSNTQPTSATPGPGLDRANYIFNDGIANGINGGYAVTQSTTFDSTQNYLTDVGAYGTGSESFYGTADQNGNVFEWNDSLASSGIFRVVRGGSWASDSSLFLRSSYQNSNSPTVEDAGWGFRIASLAPVPEPGTYAAMVGALALVVALGRRHSRSSR